MTTTLKSVRKFCLEQGEPMPPNLNILLQRLDEDGFLIRNSKGNRTHSVRVNDNKNLRVAIFKHERFLTSDCV